MWWCGAYLLMLSNMQARPRTVANTARRAQMYNLLAVRTVQFFYSVLNGPHPRLPASRVTTMRLWNMRQTRRLDEHGHVNKTGDRLLCTPYAPKRWVKGY